MGNRRKMWEEEGSYVVGGGVGEGGLVKIIYKAGVEGPKGTLLFVLCFFRLFPTSLLLRTLSIPVSKGGGPFPPPYYNNDYDGAEEWETKGGQTEETELRWRGRGVREG